MPNRDNHDVMMAKQRVYDVISIITIKSNLNVFHILCKMM